MTASESLPVILDHATVLDVVGGVLVPNQRVTLEGGRIARIESAHTPVTDAESCRIIDLAGKTLMPGL